MNHSPCGFAWGYSGSGPAQFALAMACVVLDDDQAALQVYGRLKERVVARPDLEEPFRLLLAEVAAATQAVADRR